MSEGEQAPDQEASVAAGTGDGLPFGLPPFKCQVGRLDLTFNKRPKSPKGNWYWL